ncbi:hypothetical protein ACFVZH_02615 [Streptomyces sp. NPDC059534]|uniref:hypothetical protein n=1 Tax=Streptomyces sp. NPDC059534 TaxID=3346859 RepID=UPI003678EE2A
MIAPAPGRTLILVGRKTGRERFAIDCPSMTDEEREELSRKLSEVNKRSSGR